MFLSKQVCKVEPTSDVKKLCVATRFLFLSVVIMHEDVVKVYLSSFMHQCVVFSRREVDKIRKQTRNNVSHCLYVREKRKILFD